MKKIKNKKGLILGATLGSSIGTAAGLIPLLLRDFEKNEVIKVHEFQSSNVFQNGATIDFKLDNESMSENVYETLKNNPDLNINILEHSSRRIFDTQKIKFNENKKSYSVDLKNLEAGKIYTFQILDLNRVNYTFDIHQDSSFIITKPEVKTINYQFNQKQVDIKMLFADEMLALNDQEVEITIKKASDPNVVLTTKAKITLTEEVDQLSNKRNVPSLTAKFENLERNTDYYIDKIATSTDVIAINRNAKSEFRTAIARTELQKINVVSRSETSTTLDLYWNNEDQDVENKFINIYYAQREKNSDGSYSYKNLNVLNKVQITKVIENNLNKEVEVYKTTVNIDNLIPGTSYEIIKTASLNYLENSEIVQAVIPQNIQDQWVFSTRAVVESIKVDTEVEKSAFVTVKFKDDLATENNQTIYLKYKAENESDDQIKTVSELAVGNFARFNLTDLQGLVNYSILEIGRLENFDNKITTPFLYKDTFDENQKHFIPTISNILITDINFDRNKTGETNTKATVDFNPTHEFLVGRKARINFSEFASDQAIIYPNNENSARVEGIEIKKENGRIFAEFSIDNLQGGTTYVVNEVFLDDDPNKNIVENSLQLKFSSSISANKRSFTTKAVLNDIYFESKDPLVDLSLNFKNSFAPSDPLSFENKRVTIKFVDIESPNAQEQQETTTISNNYARFELKNLKPDKVFEIKSVSIENYNTSNNNGELLDISPLITPEKRRFFTTANTAVIASVTSMAKTINNSSLTIQFVTEDLGQQFLNTIKNDGTNNNQYAQSYFDSTFINNSTLILKYRKVGSSIVSDDVKEAIINDQSTASFDFSNLEIGTKYVIHSLEIKKDQFNNIGKNVPKVIYNDATVSENDKVFTTKNGIRSIEFDNIEQQKARVIINLADATNEYDKKQFKLTYKTNTNTGEQKITSELVTNINNRLIFDLANLNKVSKYTIEKVEMLNEQTSSFTSLPFNNLITENNKEFWTNFTSATVQSINQTNKSLNSATVEVTFNNEDEAIFTHNFPLKMKYRLLSGVNNEVDLEADGTINQADKKFTFNLDNLQDGSTYYITGFVLKTKDNDNIEIIDDRTIAVNYISLPETQKQISTTATWNYVNVETFYEASAVIYVSFKDSKREIINRELKIEAQEVDDSNIPTGQIYSSVANSEGGLYIFNLTNLPKTKKMKVINVKYNDNNQAIDKTTDQEKLAELETNSFFTVKATNINITQIQASNETDTSVRFTLTIDSKDNFANNKQAILKYRGLDSTEIHTFDQPKITIANNQAIFDLNNLKPGNRYEIVDFIVDDYQTNIINLPTSEKIAYTTNVVENYQVLQTSDTSVRLVVSIADLSRRKNDYNVKLFYKLKNDVNNTIIETNAVKINNGVAIFNLSSLAKASTYVIERVEISDANNSNNFSTLKESLAPTVSKEFTLVPQLVTINALNVSVNHDNAIVIIEAPESDAYLENRQVTLVWKKQGDQNFSRATSNYAISTVNGSKKVSATFNLSNLEAGSIYSINSLETDQIEKTVFDLNISDESKKIITLPEISKISSFAFSELNYKVNLILKDPLSGTGDSKSYDNRQLTLTYYEKTNPNTEFTVNSNVNLSSAEFDINNNLVKGKTYVIKSIRENTNSTDLTFNASIDQAQKEFTVIPKTANLEFIEYSNITNNSATVTLKFAKSEDGYLFEKNKSTQIEYRSSDHDTNKLSNSVNPTESGNYITYSFDLNDLGHGANVRIIKEIIPDITIYTKGTATNKEFNTLATVNSIRNYKHELENKWNVELTLKDLLASSENSNLKIEYFKVAEPQTILTSNLSRVNSNKANFVLENLEDFTDYKVKNVYLVANNNQSQLELENSIQESDKTFKVIPQKVVVSEVANRQSTTNSASFSLYFDESDKNYLKTYTNITLNYRLKGTEQIKTINSVISEDPINNKLKADFNFTVNNDGFIQGSYEMVSLNFLNDNFTSDVVNVNNPHRVRVYFGETINSLDRTFSTVADVKEISSTTSDQSAEIIVQINDPSQIYVGLETKIVYTINNNNQEIISEPSNMNVGQAGKSEAVIYLNNLEKAQTYSIKKVLLNQVPMPFDQQFNNDQKIFKTTAKNATVVAKEVNNTLETESATVTLKFDSVDKFIVGTTNVVPNLAAQQLYLIFSSNTTGQQFKSAQTTATLNNNDAQITFNLTNLNPGDSYTIISLTETENGILDPNNVKYTFKDTVDLNFKTKPAIGTINKNTDVEKTASLTFQVIDNDNLINLNQQGVVNYKHVATNQTFTQTFNYDQRNSFTLELNNLQKNSDYEITSVSIGNENYDFASTANNEMNKRFKTNYKTADVTINANNDYQESTGRFTLNFGQYDDFLNDGWNVNIKYTTRFNISEIISYPTPVSIQNKQAVFDVSNLKGGETYEITEVIFSKANGSFITANLTNKNNDVAWIKTKAKVARIRTISNFQDTTVNTFNNSQAIVDVVFDNNNLNLAANDNVSITVLTSNNIQSTGSKHQTTATTAVMVDNNNNNNNNTTASFLITDLVPGLEYKIVSISKVGGTTIAFNDEINSDTHEQRKFRAFVSRAYLRDNENIEYSNITNNSITVKVPFKDDFVVENQKAWVTYTKNDGSSEVFRSNEVNINSQTKDATFNLTNLDGGIEYQITGITVIPAFVSVASSDLLTHNDIFKTKPEISAVVSEPINQTSQKVKIRFFDAGDYIDNKTFKIKVVKKNNPAQAYYANASANTNAEVDFTVTGLEKNTEYLVSEITDTTTNEVIQFSKIFAPGSEYALTKEFRTVIDNIDVTFSGQQDSDIKIDGSKVKFTFDASVGQKLLDKTLSLTYQKLSTGAPTGNFITSPINIRLNQANINSNSFEFDLTKEFDNLESGTEYKIIRINDLAQSYERVSFTINKTNNSHYDFSTFRAEPKILTITPLKPEKISLVDVGDDQYSYSNKFRFTFDDPNHSLNWTTVNSWSATVSYTENGRQINIPNNRIRISQEIPNTLSPNMIVDIISDDIRTYIGKKLTFTFRDIQYTKKTNNTLSSKFNVNTDYKNDPLTSLIKTQIVVEEILYPRYSGSQWMGFTLRVYDPLQILQNTPTNNPWGTADTWTRITSPYPVALGLEVTNAFGSDGFTYNSDGAPIGNGLFAGEWERWRSTWGIGKNSNFRLRQDHKRFRGNFSNFYGSVDRISIKREKSNPDKYAHLSILFNMDAAGSANPPQNTFAKLLRIKRDSVISILSLVESNATGNQDGFLTDVTSGITVLSEKLNENYMYINPTLPGWHSNNRGLGVDYAKAVFTSHGDKLNIIERPLNLNSNIDNNGQYLRITRTSFDQSNNQFTAHFEGPWPDDYFKHTSYAVFIDPTTGNLYFAGDENAHALPLVRTAAYSKTYHLNIWWLPGDQKAPINKELRFIGLWTQSNDLHNRVFNVLVDERHYDDVMISIRLTH
ncbi:DUF1410 domain-containing protein [Mesomycoplasma lagogenitalium]|uniref:DUF1410 domain-containing protein n=1 Tax=Mesomycoplasma lagogenitalium TaxID=171286 RepID=A0ABY8LSP9_9BACT|nr:DUF1410 domain-containing protein [Mesomycoplasma lagogenitalium]WGI36284.1 DUF1410 domain-containing protein [Mesomycoplasma lagogenitalium]